MHRRLVVLGLTLGMTLTIACGTAERQAASACHDAAAQRLSDVPTVSFEGPTTITALSGDEWEVVSFVRTGGPNGRLFARYTYTCRVHRAGDAFIAGAVDLETAP